jgi:carotenoid cleavage dioxygenase-like enzyme
MSAGPNAYLAGNFAPIPTEIDAACTEVEGTIPRDLAGFFLRNGPNNQFAPLDEAAYHPFDGDGMIHEVSFRDGGATYRNRWVRTKGFERERREGKAIWGGFNSIGKMETPPDMPMKNLANTALTFHNGALLATWEAGSPYQVALPGLETVGEQTWNGGWEQAVTAHPKVDPRTGEMIVFCYNPVAQPYVSYGVVDKSGRVVHRTGIELQGGPVMIHDTAITDKHSLVFDMPVTFSLERVMNGGPAFGWEPQNGTRIGVLPRFGDGAAIRWFDVGTGYIFHAFNAWEDGDSIVLDACRTKQTSILNDMGTNPDDQLARYHRYRLDLGTGRCTETSIADIPLEFARINEGYVGVRNRYGYASRFHPTRGLLFDAILKHDREGDRFETVTLGGQRFTQEFVFAPRVGSRAEDDGYVVGFVHDEATEQTECWVLDAQRFSDGPVARIRTPQRVPYGFHSHWVGA